MSEELGVPYIAPQFAGPVHNAVTVGRVDGDILIQLLAREPLSGHALGPEGIKSACDVYVEVDAWDEAAQKFRDNSLVGLLGHPGSGRWITGVNLAARFKLIPSLLELDPDDKARALPTTEETCYLIDLATVGELATPALGAKLREHAKSLEAVGSRLVILASQQLWGSCGLAGFEDWVRIRSAHPLEVFRAHLRVLQSRELADGWVSTEQTVAALDGVTTADAVWLAALVDESVRRGLEAEAADEVFQAYRAWPDAIAELLRQTAGIDGGYLRALAVAVSVLEHAPAGQVFAAADVLAQTAGLSSSSGAGLVGPGAAAMLESVNAALTSDDRVYFPRIGYGSALLDHMWRDRHRFRAQLRSWFAAAPRERSVGAGMVWAPAITRLAVRHRDPELVIEVAESWSGGATNTLAVQALTDAAISDEAGSAVRRKLYYWATRADTAKLHALTAEVCGGEMGRRYPRIALTRLRHLATQNADPARKKVVAAVIALAADPNSRAEAIQEVKDWIYSATGARQITGRLAFLALARTADDEVLPILAAMLRRPSEVEVLSDCWWAVLRDTGSRAAARAEFVRWLDEAVSGRLSRDGVLDCLSRTCRSALDAGDIGLFLQDWAVSSAGDGSSPSSHTEIIDELSRRASRSGPSQARKLTLAQPGVAVSTHTQGGLQ